MDLDEADRRLRDIIATVQTEARQVLLDVLPADSRSARVASRARRGGTFFVPRHD